MSERPKCSACELPIADGVPWDTHGSGRANHRRIKDCFATLRSEVDALRKPLRSFIRYEYLSTEGRWLPFNTCPMDEERLAERYREGRDRAAREPHLYRNVRIVRVYRRARPA